MTNCSDIGDIGVDIVSNEPNNIEIKCVHNGNLDTTYKEVLKQTELLSIKLTSQKIR